MDRVNRQKHCHLALRGAIVGQHLGGLSNSEISRSLNVNAFTNAAVVGRQFGVHPDTVRKVWNDVGLKHRTAARKPLLTPEQRQARLNYALANINRNWDNVIFSDEKTFQSDRHQKTHLYRPDGMRFDDRYIQPTRRSGRISAGIWGWISRYGPGEMTFITGRMNSREYTEILEDVLVRTVDILFGGFQNFLFMQASIPLYKKRRIVFLFLFRG